MKAEFFSDRPQAKARPELDSILAQGKDGICIASAFVTRAGVELLKKHVLQLRHPNSFLVASDHPSTDRYALEDLETLCPGKVFLHLGYVAPSEIGFGTALMHSKVYLSRENDRGWLWVGSHNLTGNGTLGLNYEAAITVEGSLEEPIFQDAYAHLLACKQNAVPLRDAPPREPPLPPDPPEDEDTLILHAEIDAPLGAFPWYVHLRLFDSTHDHGLRPPGDVLLYLYRKGALKDGINPLEALRVCAGDVTALNLTGDHPQTKGIPADWPRATHVLEGRGGVLLMSSAILSGGYVATQSVLTIRADAPDMAHYVHLCERPRWVTKGAAGSIEEVPIDTDMLHFFRSTDKNQVRLDLVACVGMMGHFEVGAKDREFMPPNELRRGVLSGKRVRPNMQSDLFGQRDLHPDLFIYRAKSRQKLKS
jgi:HKD family nuclease